MSSLPNHLRSDFGLPIYVLFDPGQVTSLSGPQYSHLQNGDKTAHALLRGVRYAVLPRAVLSTRVSVSACSFTAITPNTVLPRSHSTSLSCTVVKTDSEPRRQAPEPRLGPQSSREPVMVLWLGSRQLWVGEEEGRLGPRLWPGLEGSAAGVCDCTLP